MDSESKLQEFEKKEEKKIEEGKGGEDQDLVL